jgi:hypothetical protein
MLNEASALGAGEDQFDYDRVDADKVRGRCRDGGFGESRFRRGRRVRKRKWILESGLKVGVPGGGGFQSLLSERSVR